MTVEHEIIERLAGLEADTKHILARLDDFVRMNETIIRLEEANLDHDKQLDILFDKSRLADNTKDELTKWVNRGLGAYGIAFAMISLFSFFAVRMIDQYDAQLKMHGELISTIDRRMAWVEFDQKKRQEKDSRQ